MSEISHRQIYIQFVRFLLGAYFQGYHHLKVEGTGYIPDHGPLFVTINHLSYLEPFALGIALVDHGVIPGVQVWTVAKKELFANPALAWFLRSIAMFPIDRENIDMTAMRTMMGLLKECKMIAVAPEGTRSPTGRLQAFQPVLAKIAISRHIPILPVGAFGAEKALPVDSKIPRPYPITIRFGHVYELSEFYALDLSEAQADAASWTMRAHVAELLPEWMRELPPPSERVGARRL